MGRLSITLLVAIVLASVLVVACGSAGSPSARHLSALQQNPMVDEGTTLPGHPAPDFTLTDQFGQSTALHQFRGKVVILAFIDSQCTTICPLTTSAMTEAQGLLGNAGSKVQLLGVDANPQATTAQDVEAYSLAHGLLHQWRFLTGSLTQLEAVWNAYKIEVQIEQGQIDHTPALFEIDPKGKLRTVYLSQMSYASIDQQAQVLAQGAAGLLPGHPKLRSVRSYDRILPIAPTSSVTLERAGASGTVTLGPGHPQVVVFFATWLSETSNLSSELEQLNAYQSQARASGGEMPSLVAVDEGSVEPGPSALTTLLERLPGPLTYQVVVDRSGRVADGYQVQDQPWFVVTSRSGKILWSNDGWVAPTVLAEHVRSLSPEQRNG